MLTIVHFSAEWAEQCKQVTEVLKELIKLPEVQSSGSKIALCDAEKLSEISLQFKVKLISNFILTNMYMLIRMKMLIVKETVVLIKYKHFLKKYLMYLRIQLPKGQ